MVRKSAKRGLRINQEIADIFYKKAKEYDLDEKKKYRAISFRKAAKVLESLDKGVDKIYKKSWLNGLKKIGGIGDRLARAIEGEILKKQ